MTASGPTSLPDAYVGDPDEALATNHVDLHVDDRDELRALWTKLGLSSDTPLDEPTTPGDVLTVTADGETSWLPPSLPVGSVIDYAGETAPAGWLMCDGSAVSRTTYAALAAVLIGSGTPYATYGAGNGSTTFNLPDLRGRVVAGKDDMGGSSANRLTSPINGDTLGAAGGSQSHTLTTAEMPSHIHGGPSGLFFAVSGSGGIQTSAGVGYYPGTELNAATATAGSDGAHNNMQPTFILNKIIFAGV